jgi:hypothetical protein
MFGEHFKLRRGSSGNVEHGGATALSHSLIARVFFCFALISALSEVQVDLGNAQQDEFGFGVGHLIRSFTRFGSEHAPAR